MSVEGGWAHPASRNPDIMRNALLAALAFSAASALLSPLAAWAEVLSIVPRKANVREGPGAREAVLWQAWRLTPFLILDWVGDWAKVRDYEGDDGWVHGSLLGDSPTVIVVAKSAVVRGGPGAGYGGLWTLEEGYTLRVLAARDGWLKVSDDDEVHGWILRKAVWGRTTPDEGST